MKTTILWLESHCPSCNKLKGFALHDGRFVYNHESMTLNMLSLTTCKKCGVDYLPTIHLNEFKQAGEEA